MTEKPEFSKIPWNSITRFGQRTMLEHPLFSVSWILGRFCNYKCSYCWPYANSSTPDHQSLDTYRTSINEIKRQARANGFRDFHWSFSGGEPTAYKNLIELVKHLDDGTTPYQSIHMTTNLSPSKKWWANWGMATELLQRKSITASFHTEFADEKEFSEKCLFLLGENVHVTINQVMVPQVFWETYERCKRFRDRGINVTLKPQSNESANAIVEGYTDEMMAAMQDDFGYMVKEQEVYQVALYTKEGDEYLLDQAERFNAFDFNKFTGWSCNSGYQSVIIRGDEVKRSYSCHDPVLGSLSSGFTLFTEPKVCATPRCVSSADSKIPKCKLI